MVELWLTTCMASKISKARASRMLAMSESQKEVIRPDFNRAVMIEFLVGLDHEASIESVTQLHRSSTTRLADFFL